jgi:hypothetical protein
MSEEKKEIQATNVPEPLRAAKKAYQPPVLVQYGTIADLTKGKSASGADLLPGAKR